MTDQYLMSEVSNSPDDPEAGWEYYVSREGGSDRTEAQARAVARGLYSLRPIAVSTTGTTANDETEIIVNTSGSSARPGVERGEGLLGPAMVSVEEYLHLLNRGGVDSAFRSFMTILSDPNCAAKLNEVMDNHIDKRIETSVAKAILAMTPEQRDGIRVLLDKLSDQGG
jgi:hypothetical protein